MQQLQDKLHMNLMQSQHMVGGHDKTGSGNVDALHQLTLHQQQMVQLQLSHSQHQFSLQHQTNSHDSQGTIESGICAFEGCRTVSTIGLIKFF